MTETKQLDLLKEMYYNYPISDEKNKIDIFIVMKRLEMIMPKEIKELLIKEFPKDKISENVLQHRNEYIDDTNKMGILMRKYKKKNNEKKSEFTINIISLFNTKKDFVKIFLKKNPSPQYVGLPFRKWNTRTLSHYFKLEYECKICNRTISDVLAAHFVPNDFPFLRVSNKYFLENYTIYYCIVRILKLNNSKKYTHYLPIRFGITDTYSTNTLYCYDYKRDKSSSSFENNIFDDLERCLPKGTSTTQTLFLLKHSKIREKFFEDCFLNSNHLPKASYIFIESEDNLTELAKLNGCMELSEFYDVYTELKPRLTKALYSLYDEEDIKIITRIITKNMTEIVKKRLSDNNK